MSVYLVLVFSCHCLFSHSFFNSLIVLPRTCIITFLLFFSHQVMPISSRPHGLQQARLCPAPSPRVGPSSCPWHWWCHPTISSSITLFSFCLQSFPASGSFPMIQKFTSGDFSFSISPSKEYSGLISFRIDWFDLFTVQGTCRSLLQHHSSKASTLQHSASFMVQLSHL